MAAIAPRSDSLSTLLPVDLAADPVAEQDGALAALATALPWAISAVLHVGLFLVMFFLVVTVARRTGALPTVVEAATIRARAPLGASAYRHYGPGDSDMPAAQNRVNDPLANGFAADAGAGMDMWAAAQGPTNPRDGRAHFLGTGGGATRITGLNGTGPSGTGGPLAPFGARLSGHVEARTPNIFPPVAAHRLVYVVDKSGSMLETFDYVREELRRSISALQPAQAFHVIFFAEGAPQENAPRRLVPATPANKQQALDFLAGVVPASQTNPLPAVQRALTVTDAAGRRADLVYLLTDGEFDPAVVAKVRALNPDKATRIHTIAFVSDAGRPQLEAIARENGGKFKFVTPDEVVQR